MGWQWTFDDPIVTRLCVDYQFTLLLGDGTTIAIGEPFELTDGSATTLVPPGEAVHEVAAALPLFNQRVISVEADDSGELSIHFDSGSHLRVPVNDAYETWQITSGQGELWVGLPGGGVSHLPVP